MSSWKLVCTVKAQEQGLISHRLLTVRCLEERQSATMNTSFLVLVFSTSTLGTLTEFPVGSIDPNNQQTQDTASSPRLMHESNLLEHLLVTEHARLGAVVYGADLALPIRSFFL